METNFTLSLPDPDIFMARVAPSQPFDAIREVVEPREPRKFRIGQGDGEIGSAIFEGSEGQNAWDISKMSFQK